MELFLKALRGEPVERFPVWLMRQAGRYMPQYRRLRQKAKDFLSFCADVKLASEVTLLPEKLLGVDALILFSDILVPLQPLGIKVHFETGKGPTLETPPVEKWMEFNPSEVEYVYETVKVVKGKSSLPLIGFAGAPFTLAAYVVEGKTSRDFKEILKLYYTDRGRFFQILEKLTDTVLKHLLYQIEAGADAVQLFDSWAYVMSPEIFKVYKPLLEKIHKGLKEKYPTVPVIYFFRGGHLFGLAKELPFEALSVDWTVELSEALDQFTGAVQGNLAPHALFADKETIKREAIKVLKTAASRRKSGYVFNLGHGLMPDMEPEKVKFLVDTVRNFKL